MSVTDFSLCLGFYFLSAKFSVTEVISVGVWGAEDQMQGMLPLFCVALCQHSGSRSSPRVSLIFWFSSLCLCSRVSLAASSHK